MKQTPLDVQVKTNLTGAQRMGVDVEAMGHILSLLSNMYSDGNLAVVREYASNALDSHRVAGNDGPILITSPNHFSPTLTVQDFGTGLSEEEMLNVYAVYGTSTKRHADGQIGHFGIGAKSAFTVGAQFVVTAVKDGVMTMTLFALDETGAPTVNVIGRQETDEPDGVKVEIAVKDVDGVVGAIERLFSTWAPGTVLVDGVEPTHIWDSVEEMTEGVHIGRKSRDLGVLDSRAASWTLVMGGIPYALPSSVVTALEYRTRTIVQSIQQSNMVVYLTVPLGAVDITPSREELRNTDKTVATVNAMVEKFHLALGGWVTSQIADAPSLISAMIKHDQLRHDLGGLSRLGATITWKGQRIPDNIVHTKLAWFKLARRRGGSMVARRDDDYDIHPIQTIRQILFLTGVPERKMRSVQITARAFLEAQDSGSLDKFTRVVPLPATATQFTMDWFTTDDVAVRTMTYDQFIADWKPAQAPSTARGPVRYPVFQSGSATVADLKGETTIYYLTSYDRTRVNLASDIARGVVGSAPLIMLKSSQKAEVLVKRLPQAVNLLPAAHDRAAKILASVTQDDLDALDAQNMLRSVDHTMIHWLQGVKTDLTHKGLLDVIVQYDRARAMLDDPAQRTDLIQSALRLASKSRAALGGSTWDTDAWNKVISTLPLLSTYFARDWLRTPLGNQHALAYINMVGDLTAATTA